MKILYLIPARGGSKGIPGKNIKKLSGKPLICYSIDNAKVLSKVENICVSTDDPKIIKVAEEYGLKVPFVRSKVLATDKTSMNDVIVDAINFYEKKGFYYDAIVLLQPTSPFRAVKHVKEAIKLFSSNIDMVVSVTESEANPYFNLFEENADGFLGRSKKGKFTRRQDCPKVYKYNGAIYVINIKSLKSKKLHAFSKVRKYFMDEKLSVDLDTTMDWDFAEFLIKNKKIKL
jgi:CMP-N,N'-diacetyllegionaminic acid synthase